MKAGDFPPGAIEGDKLLVRPSDGYGVMEVDGGDGVESDREDDGEALRLDEPPERLRAELDGEAVRHLSDPRLPSLKEVEHHNLTHVPYRNWCPICVRCMGKDLDHRRAVEEDTGVSEYAFDYCFPGDELDFKLVVLAGREKVTGAYFATAVPTKGGSGRFPVDKALDYFDQEGSACSSRLIRNQLFARGHET